ncbi:MAG: class I SAM-dependent methyltransferase family protein [Myxococcales bacterium]|nr:class I SAM-dependent methyltransferase family protein [Myxococcales bacterium]
MPLHRVRTYEDLDGAQGREVFFRPHRYRVGDLAPLKAVALIRTDATDVLCHVLDVSQNGVGMEWPPEVPVAVGDRIAHVSLKFDEHEAYAGEARIGSVREAGNALVVGLSFEGPLISMDDVLELRTIKAFSEETAHAAPWHAPGLDRFKVLVSELRLYLEDWKVMLDALESRLPWHVLNGDTDSPARRALIEQLRSGFAAEVVKRSEEIDAALRSAPPSHQQAMKHFSHRQVHEFMMQSPCLHRMLHKPFGYPGDYEMMRFIYERNFEGATLFGKAVNLAFVATKASMAVKCRKDLIRERLKQLIAARGGSGAPLRILSVAAGPAQELVELLEQAGELPAPLEIVLFDQDKGALSYAWRRLKNVIDRKWQKRVQVLFLNESIKRLLRDAQLFAAFGEFDAIFSCGLFDYLQPSTGIVLTRNLYARLAPGGKLLIGNMVPENPTRWIMEHHLDWQLIYRSRTELSEIARRAAPAGKLQILEEETGVNPFIELTKD